MAHGFPDWGQTAGTKTTYQLTDLAELAARLGSIDTFDRRGDVIMLDGFEDGFSRWSWASGSGAGARDLVTYPVKSGAISARLETDASLADSTLLTLIQPFPVFSKLGLEVAFQPALQVFLIEFIFYVYDGAQSYDYAIRYDPVNARLLYKDSAGAWQTLADLDYPVPASGAMSILKLVVDPENAEYERVILNSQGFPMAGIPCRLSSSSLGPYLYVVISLFNLTGNLARAFFDDVIITQNEP